MFSDFLPELSIGVTSISSGTRYSREFYIDYQPWITLIYITIYASPFITYRIINLL